MLLVDTVSILYPVRVLLDRWGFGGTQTLLRLIAAHQTHCFWAGPTAPYIWHEPLLLCVLLLCSPITYTIYLFLYNGRLSYAANWILEQLKHEPGQAGRGQMKPGKQSMSAENFFSRTVLNAVHVLSQANRGVKQTQWKLLQESIFWRRNKGRWQWGHECSGRCASPR